MLGCTCVPVTVRDTPTPEPWLFPAPVMLPPASSASVRVIVPIVMTPVHVPEADGVLASVDESLSRHPANTTARARMTAALGIRMVASLRTHRSGRTSRGQRPTLLATTLMPPTDSAGIRSCTAHASDGRTRCNKDQARPREKAAHSGVTASAHDRLDGDPPVPREFVGSAHLGGGWTPPGRADTPAANHGVTLALLRQSSGAR